MILAYRDKKTGRFASGEFVKAFGGFENQAAKRLAILNAAPMLETLRALPSNRLEALKGARAGQYVDFHPELSRVFHREVSHL